MLNRCYYIRPWNDHDSAPPPAGITIAHVPEGDSHYRELVTHQYSPEGNYPFCLGLKHPDDTNAQELHRLLVLLFHPFYESAAGGKPFFVFAADGEEAVIRDRLQPLFDGQRLNVDLIFLPDTAPSPVSILRPSMSGESAGDYYDYYLQAYDADDTFLFLAADRVEDYLAALHRFQSSHPLLYRLASDNARMRKEINTLTGDRAAQVEEKNILQQLLDLNRKHNEVDYILNFYKHEYEVLPLWYKRAGHILKVIMGKRTFRSLYDKTAKKYKD